MSRVTFIWGLTIGACVTMALPHLLIGLKNRAWANLFFVLAALSVASSAVSELEMMHSRTTEQIGRAMQWAQVPTFLVVLAIAGFVGAYFGTGRLWLGVAACAARFACLVINFAFPPNLTFREITALRHFDFLGETIAMPVGVVSPWARLAQLSSLLLLAFVIDASFTLWRRGSAEARRRALVVGGSMTLFIVLVAGLSAVIIARGISVPFLPGVLFMGVIVAMGFELSYDIIRAAQTTRQLCISESALRESEVRVSMAASQLRILSRQIFHIQEEERRHLARELHDEIGQALTAAKINLQSAIGSASAATSAHLQDTTAILDRLLGQVRQISLDLRPPMLDDLGLVPALRSLLDEQGRRASVEGRFTSKNMPENLDPEIQTTCFRIAQEAITNALRHADATQIKVDLRCEGGKLRLLIRDNGLGFDAESVREQRIGLGLVGITERAALLGGRAGIISSPGKGTTIEVVLPLTLRDE